MPCCPLHRPGQSSLLERPVPLPDSQLAHPEARTAAPQTPKMGKAKKKTGSAFDDAPEAEDPLAAEPAEPAAASAQQRAAPKKAKKGRRKGAADWDSDGEPEDVAAPAAAPAAPKAASKAKSAGSQQLAFLALEEDQEEDQDAGSEASTGRSAQPAAAASAFDALGEDDDAETEPAGQPAKEVCAVRRAWQSAAFCGADECCAQVPVRVAEIVKAGKHPSAPKLKVCTVSDGSDVFQVQLLHHCIASWWRLLADAGSCRRSSQMQPTPRRACWWPLR